MEKEIWESFEKVINELKNLENLCVEGAKKGNPNFDYLEHLAITAKNARLGLENH